MRTVTVQITNNSALKTLRDLEGKKYIRIVKTPRFESPALPGKEMDLPAFEAWITSAENAPSISLKEAKSKWAAKKKQLQRLTR